MTFPEDPLDVRVELQLAGAWTDVTGYVLTSAPITITRGRRDETSTVSQGQCTLTLKNPGGIWSDRNPASPYYGQLGRNTPLRVSVPGASSYLELNAAGGYAVRGHADLGTGGMDLIVELDSTAPTARPGTTVIAEQWGSNSNPSLQSWRLLIVDGAWRLDWVDTTGQGWTYTWRQWLLPGPAYRFTLDVAAGTIAASYAPTSAGPWTLALAAATTSTGVQATTNTMVIGHPSPVNCPDSRITRLELRDGSGTLVAGGPLTGLADGATGWTDGTGAAWVLHGAARITTRAVRFCGEVASWPPRWDTAGQAPTISVTAAGILRRLNAGARPLQSALRRRLPSYGPSAYWPLEDAAGATQAASPITGCAPATATNLTWAQATSLPASDALPVLASTGDGTVLPTLTGTVPAPSGTLPGWQVIWLYQLDTGPDTLCTMMQITTTGTVRTWTLMQGASTVGSRIVGTDAHGGTVVDVTVATGDDIWGSSWQLPQFRLTQTGGTVAWAWLWEDVGGDAGEVTGTYSGTVGHVTQLGSPPGGWPAALDGMAIGHLAVWPTPTTDAYLGAVTSYSGEAAGTRLLRLAQESGQPLVLAAGAQDGLGGEEPLGPQHVDTLTALLAEAAAADGGILHETRGWLGLRYRDRRSLYHQDPAVVLTYGQPGLAPPLEPEVDDQLVVNDVTVTRANGSSGRATLDTGALSTQPPPDGIGVYAAELTLSLAADAQAQPQADWRLWQGTRDALRYPTVTVALHRAPDLIPAVCGVETGDAIALAGLPVWVEPGVVPLLVQGYTETLGQRRWTWAATCTPGAAWATASASGGVLAMTDGSVLADDVGADGTTLTVTTTAGPTWTTDPADTPWDVVVGGEQMTVTAVVGDDSPQTMTVVRGVNGIRVAHAAETPVQVALAAITSL